jgi:SNF2 family DNA or RNA helicase
MAPTILRLLDTCRIGITFDEAHKIKNPQAKVTKASIKLARKATWRVVMTGTPVTNTGQDLWSQMYVVDLGITFGPSFSAFREEFFIVNPWSHESSMRPHAQDAINARLQRRALRYRQQDCFDMPTRLHDVIPIAMTDEQRRAYVQMENELVTVIMGSQWETDTEGNPIEDLQDDMVSRASIVLTQYLRLSQITSGFLPMDDGTVHFFDPNPKLDALENEVRQLIEDGQPALVWAWYRHDIANINRRLLDLQPVIIAGGMTAAQSEAAEAAFQSGASPVLIGNPGSGGLGLKLTAATHAFYYSQSFSMEHREQSEARNYEPAREGRRTLYTFDLCVPHTIDELILRRVRDKQSLAAILVEVRQRLGAAV